MGLKRWRIIAMYRYTASSQYCTWFHNTSQREFQFILMWFNYVMQKNKHWWSWRSWLSIMYQILANGGKCQKVFWHHHTLHQQLGLENSLAGTKNNTQLLQYLHMKEPSLLRASDCKCWYFSKHFIGSMDQNVLNIRMVYRNILPLVGNGKYICRAIIFYAKVSQWKILTKIR
jgi:hypothetical protein